MNISRGPSRTLGKVGLGRCNDTTSSICQVYTGINIAYLIFVISFTLNNVYFVKYDVTVFFLAQVLDTVTYFVPQVLDTVS